MGELMGTLRRLRARISAGKQAVVLLSACWAGMHALVFDKDVEEVRPGHSGKATPLFLVCSTSPFTDSYYMQALAFVRVLVARGVPAHEAFLDWRVNALEPTVNRMATEDHYLRGALAVGLEGLRKAHRVIKTHKARGRGRMGPPRARRTRAVKRGRASTESDPVPVSIITHTERAHHALALEDPLSKLGCASCFCGPEDKCLARCHIVGFYV